MPSLRNSGQNTFFPKKAKLSESFSCTYSFQILCLEFQTPVVHTRSKYYVWNSKHPCLEFQTSCNDASVFGIPNIMHSRSCVFGSPNMWYVVHVSLEPRSRKSAWYIYKHRRHLILLKSPSFGEFPGSSLRRVPEHLRAPARRHRSLGKLTVEFFL